MVVVATVSVIEALTVVAAAVIVDVGGGNETRLSGQFAHRKRAQFLLVSTLVKPITSNLYGILLPITSKLATSIKPQ